VRAGVSHHGARGVLDGITAKAKRPNPLSTLLSIVGELGEIPPFVFLDKLLEQLCFEEGGR
jgi:hypothetical protein